MTPRSKALAHSPTQLPLLIWVAASGSLLAALVRSRFAESLELSHIAGLATALFWVVLAAAAGAKPWRPVVASRLGRLPRAVWYVSMPLYVLGLTGAPFDKWIWCLFAFGQLLLLLAQPRPAAIVLPVLGALGLLLLEGMLAALRFTPAFSAIPGVQPLARGLYIADWNVINFDPDCMEEDTTLIYRLRPGGCVFSNTEFRTTVGANSAGLRDDEQSLDAPEIIVLGDSYAMGWGIGDDETFAARLESRTGRRVLNAGISSYGTARQMLLLRELDLTSAETIIVQYCGNDYAENLEFTQAGNRMPGDALERYRPAVRVHRGRRYRFPFYGYLVYSRWLAPPVAGILHAAGWPALGERLRRRPGGYHPDPTAPSAARDETELLVHTLASASDLLAGKRLLLCRLDAPDRSQRRTFLATLRQTVASSWLHEQLAAVRILDLQSALDSDDYFDLDPHLTAAGHDKIARMLEHELRAGSGNASVRIED